MERAETAETSAKEANQKAEKVGVFKPTETELLEEKQFCFEQKKQQFK